LLPEGAGPGGAGGAGTPAPFPSRAVTLGPSRVPQAMQNTLWSGTAVWHFGQVTARVRRVG
jgi:hypothetical protein